MAGQNPIEVSVHDMLKMRGDMALAGLKAVHASMTQLMAGVGQAIAEMDRLETQYALSDTAGKDAASSLVAAVRKMRPDACEGKSDEEVIKQFNLLKGGQ